MKKYIAILLLLITSGAVLGFFTVKQNMELDEEVYLGTTASVRHLKILDNSINLLLFKIRYENGRNYSSLEELIFSTSDEFDNLRFEALFEEIESSPELDSATNDLGEKFIDKQENIELFIESHKVLVSAKEEFRKQSRSDSSLNRMIKELGIDQTVTAINSNFYRYLQNNSEDNKSRLNNNIANIASALEIVPDEKQLIIYHYIKVLSEVIQSTEETNKYFSLSVDQATAERLNTFEAAYVDFHNHEIDKANQLRNVLIIYGLILLVVLLVFAYLLSRQYINLEQQVTDRTEEIANAYNELKESQEQLIQSEKMASLGEMVAGVAHEINTPLGYVNSNVDTVKNNLQDVGQLLEKVDTIYQYAVSKQHDNKKLSRLLSATLKEYMQLEIAEGFEESLQLLGDSQHGLSEISGLVVSLKDFARLDRQSTDEIDVHDCIESSLKIACNHIKENNVTVNQEFAELPNIVCTPSKLNQLFLNIITNASQAMKHDGGVLTIKTYHLEESIVISFNDQGVGMDEATAQKMFDPFFTSKPIGEGTGLGMSIAYKIVQAHGGEIQVKSKPNVGTTIAVWLPTNHLEV